MASKSKNKRKKVKKQKRNWLDLPRDVTANILYRVGVMDILENAQKVCTAWRNICKDPSMWRVVYMEDCWDPRERPSIRELCKHVVDRSQGQLVELTIVNVSDFEFLMYLADRSSQLRRLEINYCYGDLYDGWNEVANKFPLLEELSLHTTDFSEDDIKAVGGCCPLLKKLTLNYRCNSYKNDGKALAIAENLPNLRNLELIGFGMSNIGLQAILDSCHHLETLDLRGCFYIDLKGDLGDRCSKQIKYLKLPHDSLEGYPHEFEICDEICDPDDDEDHDSFDYGEDEFYEESDYDDYTRYDNDDLADLENLSEMLAFMAMFG